jgi:hypothetical protein
LGKLLRTQSAYCCHQTPLRSIPGSILLSSSGGSFEWYQVAEIFAGIEGKQVQVCDPGKVQVWDSRRLQQLDDCVRGNDNKSNG